MTNFPSNCDKLCLSLRGKTLEPYLDENLTEEQLAQYLLSDKVLLKYCRVLDVRQRSSSSSCCFTKAYTHYAEGTGSVLQHNDEEKFDEKFSEYENDGEISRLKSLKLRYFTPREIANLMGFPCQFDFPTSTSLKTRYRLLGNSLNVFVVSSLFKILLQ